MSNIDLKGLNDLDLLFSPLDNTVKDNLLLTVPIDNLKQSPFQPRKTIQLEDIQELAESIKSQGIIQPIIVRKVESFFEIIAGERRWQAARVAGLMEVPVIIRDVSDSTVIAFALIENTQRQELNVIDEAKSIKRLVEEFELTHENIGRLLGKSRSSISNIIRMLNLPDNILKMLEEGVLEKGHAKILVGLELDMLNQIMNVINERKISIRELEDLIYNLKDLTTETVPQKRKIDIRIQSWQERLMNKLQSKVSVKLTKEGKGRVVIKLDSADEIDWLVNKLEQVL